MPREFVRYFTYSHLGAHKDKRSAKKRKKKELLECNRFNNSCFLYLILKKELYIQNHF